MSATRRLLISLGLLGLIGVHLFEIATKGTHWPFGQYEMYAHLDDRWDPTRLQFVGLTADQSEIILTAPTYSAPLPSFHTRLALGKALANKDLAKRQAALQRICADCLGRYNAHRRNHARGWPPLQSVRLYEETWDKLDPWAVNAAHPDHKSILYEYRPTASASARTVGAAPADAVEGRP